MHCVPAVRVRIQARLIHTNPDEVPRWDVGVFPTQTRFVLKSSRATLYGQYYAYIRNDAQLAEFLATAASLN